MSTLAPPMFPKAMPPTTSAAPTAARVRPFGLTTATPARPDVVPAPAGGLSLCPQRQVTVTAAGEPFISAPSMKTAFPTAAQTTEDSQLDEETENDTD